jgi:hypothetical protein
MGDRGTEVLRGIDLEIHEVRSSVWQEYLETASANWPSASQVAKSHFRTYIP